jgi:hypothetical protein
MSTTHSNPSPRSHIRRLRGERGAAVVEFSLVFILFIALLYGIIAFGMMLALKQSVTNAAAEGARAAVGADPNDPVEQADVAYQAAADRLGWLGDRCCTSAQLPDPSVATLIAHDVVPCDPALPSGDQCMAVSIDYSYADAPLVPAMQLPGFGFFFPETISSQAKVQLPPPS